MFVLTVLNLSPAFGPVDHLIFFHILQSLYGICGTFASWFESYLTGMTQTVTVAGQSSRPADVNFRVPQGLVLGPIHFMLYTSYPF